MEMATQLSRQFSLRLCPSLGSELLRLKGGLMRPKVEIKWKSTVTFADVLLKTVQSLIPEDKSCLQQHEPSALWPAWAFSLVANMLSSPHTEFHCSLIYWRFWRSWEFNDHENSFVYCPILHLSLSVASTADSYFSISHLHNTKTVVVALTSVSTEAGTLNQASNTGFNKEHLASLSIVWCDGREYKKKMASAEFIHASGWRAIIHFWGIRWCISGPMGQALLKLGYKEKR